MIQQTMRRKMRTRTFGYMAIVVFGLTVFTASQAFAREVEYDGSEQAIYVSPGEPTQIVFPSAVVGGFKVDNSSIALERQDNYLIVFAKPSLKLEGEGVVVQVKDKRTYSIRLIPSSDENPRDGNVLINDLRPPPLPEGADDFAGEEPKVSRNPVAKLMKQMVLVAEFGKRKGIPGFRRSNRFSGETVLHDGTIEAKIDEIFMGTDLWGYVLSVENMLDTTQRLNPATFRLDGTRAVVAEKWQLAPKPHTAEQHISKGHIGKVYIVTRAKRR